MDIFLRIGSEQARFQYLSYVHLQTFHFVLVKMTFAVIKLDNCFHDRLTDLCNKDLNMCTRLVSSIYADLYAEGLLKFFSN